jgi:nucleoside-diphosphate-sugar epimerase
MDVPARSSEWPEAIDNEQQLEELLSRPAKEVVDLFARLEGDLAIVGGAGKIGPSLTAMACRARQQAGTHQEIIVIDRFPYPAVREAIQRRGARTVAADLLDPGAVEALPDAENVVYMVGMKFGTTDRPALTWAVNALIPAYVGRRYRNARIVAFSTGCVYDFVPAESSGSVESDPLTPPGEYSNSCVARERILQFCSSAYGTRLVLLRLNYAVEMRYGVLVDLATDVAAGKAVDVTMGYFNAIWQGDVSAAVLRLLEHAACPPRAINLTGPEKLSSRQVAARLGELMGKEVKFTGAEGPTALLSDASAAHELLGEPAVPIEQVLKWTAGWIAASRATLGKPTHFQVGDGKY